MIDKGKRLKNGLINLRGKKIGYLEVIIRTQSKKYKWKCKCVCGKVIIVPHFYLIRKNPKTHCGCQNGGLPAKYKKEYHSWWDAKNRTSNPNHPSYPYYGAKGIRMCDSWKQGFEFFFKDMGPAPRGFTLDRINAHGHYELANCRWADDITQARNKKLTKYVVHPKTHERVKAADLTDEYGYTYQKLRIWMIEQKLWYDPQKFKNQDDAFAVMRKNYGGANVKRDTK